MRPIFLLLGLLAGTALTAQVPCPGLNSQAVLPGNTTKLTTPTRNDPPSDIPAPNINNDRIIYWCHGLGGDASSWARVGGATQSQSIGQSIQGYPARRVVSLYPTYQQFSFSAAAGSLHNAMISQGDPVCAANGITDKTVNFIVAHSQGGLVARATDKMLHDDGLEAQRRFGGIVTFGTAHQGAMILNHEKMLLQLGEDGCKALTAGPLEDTLQQMPLLDILIPNQTLQQIKNGLCALATARVLPIMFQDQFQPITEDYQVGAAALANLNGYTSALPKVAFYGVEEEPVFYRLMYSLNVKTPNEFPPFQADPDQELVDKFSSLLAQYKARYEENKMFVESLEGMGLPCDWAEWLFTPQFCLDWDAIYWRKLALRNAWKQGYDWLLESNNQWKVIIGARIPHLVQGTAYECRCDTYDGSMQLLGSYTFPVTDPGECAANPGSGNECTPLSQPVFYTTFEEKENDGIVLAESASQFPAAPTYPMLRSNHQQMRNDSNTKLRMREILDGTHGNYFLTAIRF